MRVVIYDNTDLSRDIDIDSDGHADFKVPSLSYAWWAGAKLFKGMGRFDVAIGVSSWEEFFEVLIALGKEDLITEIQFWGHGWFGAFYLDGVPANAKSLSRDRRWAALRDVMAPNPLWWFRTCSTFGGGQGRDFAQRWSHFFQGPVAGHTAIIGTWGVHSHGYLIQPGDTPHWSNTDGCDAKGHPVNSKPWLPNTIPCLHSDVPASWGNHANASGAKHSDRNA